MEYLSVIEWNEILGTIDQPRLPGNSVGVDTKTACIAQFDGPCPCLIRSLDSRLKFKNKLRDYFS